MEKINISDCTTVELSVDQVAKVLFFKDRIFRVISEEYIKQVKDMFDCGFINELVEKKLFPKTWISDVIIEKNELVLEHENIKHWNYPYEWSFDMLKDAGLTILEVNKIANKYGYQIMDGHAYNVVFNMNNPQYIDFGSFKKTLEKENNSWASYYIFFNHFYIPLYLWANGYSDTARNIFLMNDYCNEEEFYKIKYPIYNKLSINYFSKLMANFKKLGLTSRDKIKKRINQPGKQKLALILNSIFKNIYTVENLEKSIISLKKPLETSAWNDYHNEINPKENKRFNRILELIGELKDAISLIELASNQGKFSEYVLNNSHLKKIIATDYDKEAVNIMYSNNKGKNNFLSLLFDMVRTNGRKYDEYIDVRLKSDIVMALAVTHHLILTQNISIDYIFSTLSKLTNKYVIVEFMPIGLYGGDINNIPELPEYYNLEWFKRNFLNYFELILDEQLELNRHVFVGKIKELN